MLLQQGAKGSITNSVHAANEHPRTVPPFSNNKIICKLPNISYKQTGVGPPKKHKVNMDILSEAPREINVLEYAEARACEMEAMAKACRMTKRNKLVNQMMPRHMRRRAASHNVKRLPRRLQEAASREIEKCPPNKTKRPSRRHRRRPGNLLQEYNRRKRKHVWLETHIWHAKRFHMIEQWGYKIPLHPNDKGVRAAYRAAAHHCLLHDLSYLCCIEIRGREELIMQQLSRLTSSELGPTIGAATYIKGTREGVTVFYKHDQYPCSAIGEVRFLWKPVGVSTECITKDRPSPTEKETPQERSRHLWLWTHPGCYSDLLRELQLLFSLKVQTESGATAETSDQGETGKEKPTTAFANTIYSNEVNGITLKSLKDKICRFRLTGPASNAVLLEALHIADTETSTVSDTTDPDKACQWWETVFSIPEWQQAHQMQASLWQMMKTVASPGELSPHSVLGLTVRDPRVFIPKKKTKTENDLEKERADPQVVSRWPEEASWSPIWVENIREEVTKNRMSEQEFNKKRSQVLVPGTVLELGREESRIPLLLLQNNDLQPSLGLTKQARDAPMLGFGAGWDLILPSGWSMAFWVSLVYRGARAGGLKELNSINQEQGQLLFPDDYPDTPACKEMEESTQQSLQAKYNRIPPAKRPNYIKLGVVAPFKCPWKQLVDEWATESHNSNSSSQGDLTSSSCKSDSVTDSVDFMVVRCKKTLRILSKSVREQLQDISSSSKVNSAGTEQTLKAPRMSLAQTSVHDSRTTKSTACSENEMLISIVFNKPRCLVPVRVSCILRGVPEAFSMICLPNAEDLSAFKCDKKYGGPVESIHKEHCEKTAKSKETKKKKKNKKHKNKSSDKPSVSPTTENAEVSSTSPVSNSCSRTIIGYVKHGSFSFALGHGSGMGFVDLNGLMRLLQKRTQHGSTMVLIRSPLSLQFRFAHLSVVC